MDGFRRTALILLVLLPMLMLVGCGGDDDDDDGGVQGRIVFQSGDPANPNVFTMNGTGTNQQLVLTDANDPALSPNGQTIAFARGGDIFLANANGTGVTNITNNAIGVEASNPTFNAQGTRIAYVLTPTAPGADPTIRVMDVSGNNDTELVANGDDPTFSPNGNQIIFVRDSDLFTINTNGTGLTQLTTNPAGTVVSDPSFSPLGDRAVFAFQTDAMDNTPELRFINVNNMVVTNLVDDASQPAFSPFADRVVFVRDGAIFTVNTNGTGLLQLTQGTTDAEPDWSAQ